MRKLAITFVLGLLAVISVDSGPARAQQGVVTFRFVNSAAYTIFIKMFSQNRRWVWPGPTTHYILNDRTERAARLGCVVGEKICFGGSYNANDTPIYWGLGLRACH